MKIMYSIPILISLPFIDALKFFSIELFFLVHLVFLLFFFTFFKKTVYDLNKHIIKLFAFLFFVVGVLFFFKKWSLVGIPIHGYSFLSRALRFSEHVLYIKGLLFLCSSLTVLVGWPQLKKSKTALQYVTFIGFCLFSICFLFNANKLFEAILVLESVSFCLYFLIRADSRRTRGGNEIIIKYFCMGALASGLLLFSSFVCFLLSPSSMDFLTLREVFYFSNSKEPRALILLFFFLFSFGVFFKLSVFPFHLWTPEVYDGLSGTTIVFFTVVVKGGVFLFYYRMYYLIFEPYIHDLTPFFYLVSLYSISFGAYGAVFQSRVHRLFGYSSINFMGFCIAAFFCIPANGFAAVLVNFVFYSFSTICFFYFYNRIQLPNQQLGELETVSQLGIVNRVSADVAIPLACFFLSLSGVPPFPGFFAKLLILNAAATSGHLLFVLVVSIINLFSYFYALRVVKVLFFSSESSLKARLFATFEGASRGRVVFLGCSAILIWMLFYIFLFEKVLKRFWVYFVYS